MPRLNNRFKHMAFFLYGKNPKTGRIEGPKGTGLFVGLEGKGTFYLSHFYAVTCYHVAVSAGGSILRVNQKVGGARLIEFEPHEWQFLPGGADLCAIDITERLTDQDDVSPLTPNLLLCEDFIKHEQIEIGEDGFMLGLFAQHPGKWQNLIAARFGNLSLLGRFEEPIEQPNGYRGPCHIFDMHSRPGFSGSPVFIYRTPDGDLRDHADRRRLRNAVYKSGRFLSDKSAAETFDAESNTFIMLLGIHAAQYKDVIEARKAKKRARESDDLIRDGDKLSVPGSMAMVIPAWEVEELLMKEPILRAQRDERDSKLREDREKRNVPEPEAADDATADEANPNHLEDFTRLVDVAARKKPQG